MRNLIILLIITLIVGCGTTITKKPQTEIEKLIEQFESCMPEGWERVNLINGKVRPTYWPEGIGTCVFYKEKNMNAIKVNYQLAIWFMQYPDYNPPELPPDAWNGVTQTNPAVFIGENEYVKVYMWGDWYDSAGNIHKKIATSLGLVSAK